MVVRICGLVVLIFLLTATNTHGETHIWSDSYGDANGQWIWGLDTDASGNIYLAGHFFEFIDFGGGPLDETGEEGDIFIAKLTPGGAHIWSKRIGDSDLQEALSMTVDAWGNVIITGRCSGNPDFGGGPLAANYWDIFVAKFDTNGNHIWSLVYPKAGNEQGMKVTTDVFGNVLVSGWMYGTLDFGGGPLTADDRDTFLLKLDPNGNHVWSKVFVIPGAQGGANMTTDGTGNVYVMTIHSSSVDFGGGVLTSSGGTDVFLVKYDSDGNHVWSQNYGDASNQSGGGIAIDGSGNLTVSGRAAGSIDFGGGPLTSAGGYDIFLAKLDPAGSHIWSRLHGGTGDEFSPAMTLDNSDNIVTCGSFYGTSDFGGGPLTSAGGADVYFAKYDALGNHMWSTSFGDTETQYGEFVAVDGSDNIIYAGEFQGTIDFGGGPMTATVSYFVYYHIFLTKFGDAPVPTLLQTYSTALMNENVELKWTLADTGEDMIFHVLRTDAARHRYMELINPEITRTDFEFSFVDGYCQPGVGYRYRVDVTDDVGRRTLFETDVIELPATAASLEQNLPNPFNPATTITFTVPARSHVRLAIYDVGGRLVRTLVNGVVEDGTTEIAWDAVDDHGAHVSSGVYFYRLEAGKELLTKKMILLK